MEPPEGSFYTNLAWTHLRSELEVLTFLTAVVNI